MKKTFFVLMFAAIALTVSSCCNCGVKSTQSVALRSTQWSVIEMGGKVITPEKGSNRYTARFSDDNKINGFGDCNRYFGTTEVNNHGLLKISNIGSTRIACPNQEQEYTFFEMLGNVTHFKIDGNILMLYDANDKMIGALKASKGETFK